MSGCGGEQSLASRSNAPKVMPTNRNHSQTSGLPLLPAYIPMRQANEQLPWEVSKHLSQHHVHNPAHQETSPSNLRGKSAASAATPLVCLGGGTPHKPPVLRESGHVLHEGTELADFLRTQVGNL